MSAYQDIMNKGLKGASNVNGQWEIEVGGGSFDPEDKEAYEHAAWFIQQQMSKLPTKASLEENEKTDKSKLPIFDNTTFRKGLDTSIRNNLLGGQPLNIGGENDNWNYRDERDSEGKRGRSKRAAELAN